MAVQFEEVGQGKVLEVRVSGKLSRADYERFVPEFDRLVKAHGKIRVLVEMTDFHGWDFGALWEDIKLDLKHFAHIDRLAMVGETKWQEGMSKFCRPFTTAKLRYFGHDAIKEAREWIENP